MSKKLNQPYFYLISSLVLIFLILGLTGSVIKVLGRRSLLQARLEEKEKRVTKTQELQQKLQLVQTPEFIEREAREKLNLGKEGEIIILVDPIQGTKNTNKETLQTLPNWKLWWNVFF